MSDSKNEYEGLGVLYLAKKFDVDPNKLEDELVLYGSKDLTTHAVCVWNDRKRKDRSMYGIIRGSTH